MRRSSPLAAQLITLQQLDQRLAQLARRHCLLLRANERAEQLQVVSDQLAFEQLRQTKLAHERLSDLSWELEDLEQRLRELEEQGPGNGDVLLDREVKTLRQRQRVLEGQVLEQMLQTDELDRGLSSERTKLARQILQHTQHLQRLQGWIRQVEQRLASLDVQRQQLGLQLPSPLLSYYEALRGTTNNTPVARLHNGLCVACGAAPVETARREWLTCSSCKRILIPE